MWLSKLLFLYFSILMSVLEVYKALELEFTVEIQPGQRECFHQYFEKGAEFEFEYQVVQGAEHDISCMIQSPTGRILVSEVKRPESQHRLVAQESGDFAFCLDNTFSRFSKKVVFFELISDEVQEEDDDYELLADENTYEIKLEDFKDGLSRVKNNIEKSKQIQGVLRAVESRDRSIQEDNFERVNWWSSIQLFVMVSVAVTHVVMIRGLFEDKTKQSGLKART